MLLLTMRCRAASLVIIVSAVFFMLEHHASGEITLVNDTLFSSSECSGTVEGGSNFISGEGFQTRGRGNRIVYDLGYGVNCGSLDVDITNFDPPNQFVGSGGSCVCVHIIGIFENDHCIGRDTVGADESVVLAQATNDGTTRDGRIKFKPSPCDIEGCVSDNFYLPRRIGGDPGIAWQLDAVYHIHVEWTMLEWGSAEIYARISGGGHDYQGSMNVAWPAGHPDALMNLRYVTVGRDRQTVGECSGYLDGPIYSNLVVVDYECEILPPPPPEENLEEPVPDPVEPGGEIEEYPEYPDETGPAEPLEPGSDASMDMSMEDLVFLDADIIEAAEDTGGEAGPGQEMAGGCSCRLAH
jgi:hypothetical protein